METSVLFRNMFLISVTVVPFFLSGKFSGISWGK